MLNTDTVYCIMRNDGILCDTRLCGVFLDGHEANEILDEIVERLVKWYKEELKCDGCKFVEVTHDYYPNTVKAVRVDITEDMWGLVWIEQRKLNQFVI